MSQNASGAATPTQPLPSKEQNLFRQVVKFYEGKQYKKAIKAADQILKKFPEHGETLAMKGLTLNCQDKKEEAYELVRKGLKCDLKSHVCWHVYGLLYRSDREYREAIKCYMNALRIDKENVQILRDLAQLQIQMRDLQGFADTRQQLLTLKPSNRNHWVSLAVAHHANKCHDIAVTVLDAYEATLDEVPASEAYEHSEMLLYKASVLQEGGRLEDALAVLDKSVDKIKDRLAMDCMRASLLFSLGRTKECEAAYRALLEANPDHYKLHEGLQGALGLKAAPGAALTADQVAGLTKLYDELSATYPRSLACHRIQLDFKSGADFSAALDSYARRYLRKGIPSLFMDLRTLYTDSAKVQAIQTVFESYLAPLAGTPPRFPALLGGSAEAGTESPQTRVWVLHYLAQHYDWLGFTEKALALVDEALAHTPTLIELYTVKAKVLKHSGDMLAAAHQAETARRFDLSDRYLNCMAVKAFMRAGKPDLAIKTAALFTKDGDQGSALHDMQATWFELSAGAAYLRRKEYGKALKKYVAVSKHFGDFQEDQFDFHSYCIRKSTLRAYVDMLRMEDRLYAHKYYGKGALGAVQCYVALHDCPPSTQSEEDEEAAAMAGMSAEERKKYKLKKKKEEKQRQKEADEKAKAEAEAKAAKDKEAAASASSSGKKAAAVAPKAADPDPDGAKLAAVADPLAEATKLVAMLKEHAGERLSTHVAAFEVYSRKKRMLLALSAVQRAAAIGGPSDPDAHRILVKFALQAGEQRSEQAVVQQVVDEGLKALLGGKSVKEHHEAWLKAHGGSSLSHRQAGAEALVLLDAGAKQRATDLLLATPFGSSTPLDHEQCQAVHEALASPSGPLSSEAAAAEWKKKCAAQFPHSTYFGGAAVLQLEPHYNDLDHVTEAFGKLSF